MILLFGEGDSRLPEDFHPISYSPLTFQFLFSTIGV